MASFLIFVTIYIFSRKELLFGIKLIGILSFVNVLYLFGQAAFILSDKIQNLLVFTHIQVLGYVFIPVIWYLVSSQQKRRESSFTAKQLIFIFLLPFLAAILSILYPWKYYNGDLPWINTLFFVSHRLVYDSSIGSGFTSMVFTKGVFYYILLGYSALLLILSTYNYYLTYKKSIISSKPKALVLMFITFSSVITIILGMTFKETVIFDVIPIGTSTFVIVAFYALFKYELLDLTPLAYRQVYEVATFPVFILDKHEYVISMNRKAKDLYEDKIDLKSQFHLTSFDQFDKNFSHELLEYGFYEFKVQRHIDKIYYQVKLEKLIRDHKFMGYILTYQDITSHKKELKKMEHMATYDDLTKILNRRAFYVKALEAFDDVVINKSMVSFVMFDLDEFKDVNDIYGHQAGDFVLSELANICVTQLDKKTIYARYGGEEFVLFIKNSSPNDAYEIANSLRIKIENHTFVYSNHKIKITASFGISGTEKQINKSFEQYLKDADDALYEAKHKGKNQVFIKE